LTAGHQQPQTDNCCFLDFSEESAAEPWAQYLLCVT